MTKHTARLCLAIALLVQFLLFRQFCLREVVPVFPRAYDQARYLAISYDLYDAIHRDGLTTGLASVRHADAPQGILLEMEAALAQFLVGPGRLAALETNFAHLALFQIALFAVACWAGRPVLGLALCGLLIAAGSIANEFGGIYDFRLDFAALCLGGVLICVAIRSAFFRHAGWTRLFGLVAAVLVLTRSIYTVHLAPGLLLLLGLLLATNLDRDAHDRRARIVNLLWAGALIVAIAVPSLLWRWSSIQAYYGVGLLADEAPIRAREMGVFTTLDHLTYYGRSAIGTHAGVPLLILAGLVVLALVVPSRAQTALGEAESLRRQDIRIGFAWLAATMVTTYAVLTASISKSPVVGSVFIAIALPALLPLAMLFGARERATWRVATLLGVFVMGQGVFASHMVRGRDIPPDGPDLREYGRVMDTIARLSRDFDLTAPVVSFDAVSEFTHVRVLKAMAFERLRLSLTPVAGLGGIEVGLSALSPGQADDLLARSDFALLGSDRDPDTPELYPINASLRKLAPHLYETASHTMVRVQDAAFFGRRLTLFMKPLLRCTGESGGWITSAGMTCRATGELLTSRPIIRMTGTGNFAWLGGAPVVSATLSRAGEEAEPVACQLTTDDAQPAARRPYAVACDTRRVHLPGSAVVTLSLSFDRAFVPAHMGLNADVRRLVMPWPAAIETRLPEP